MDAQLGAETQARPTLDVTRLGRKHFVSQAGLASVLQAVRDCELPAGISATTIKRKRMASANAETPYGRILRQWDMRMQDGKTVAVNYCDPAATFFHLTCVSPSLQAFLKERLEERPSSTATPWTIVFYSDQVSPGNQLKSSNKRRLETIYWSLKELSANALCHERAWFLLTTVRSHTVQKLAGGMGQLCKYAMLSFFRQTADWTAGIQLRLGEERVFLAARVGMVISDESAVKFMFDNKGASGKVPCLLCRNVVLRRYAPPDMHDPLVQHTCWDARKFLMHTQQSLQEMARYLAQENAVLSKAQLKDLQTRLGFNFAPHGVLASQELMAKVNIPDSLCFDYMHIYYVSGLWHQESNLLLRRLWQGGVCKASDIHNFFQDFVWPSRLGSKGAGARNIFESLNKSDDELKSSASEALSAYPVLRLFLSDLLQAPGLPEGVQAAVKCYLLLARVLDWLCLAAEDGGSRHADKLRQAIEAHAKAFSHVYGEDAALPKLHMAIHLPKMLQHHTQLLSCWVHERRHKELKRFANQQMNSKTGTERSLMEEMLLCHREDLSENVLVHGVGLLDAKPAPAPVLAQFRTAFGVIPLRLLVSEKAYYAPNRWVRCGDIVLVRAEGYNGIAEVCYHCHYQDCLLTCLFFYKPIPDKSNRFRVCRDEYVFVLTETIRTVCIFKAQDGICTVAPQAYDN
ncbi:unnamed protein product [Symbiodinium natans]|uniref:Uncharacterized protein n=1 Tax=Symbiodinium natans TaxID=878477 RepID=A0A812QTL6_9DINO|nr:unnamed protein product [Symbiodinium natans]